MATFTDTYKKYLEAASAVNPDLGFEIETVRRLEPVLAFLYRDWFKVDMTGLEFLPASGPALIVGNHGGAMPWIELMLLYALMSSPAHPRRLSVLADLDWIEDERLYSLLRELGFVSFSSAHAKKLFAAGEIVVVFPEGISGAAKPFSERYRVKEFDWTKLLPAVEERVPVFPLASLGCDESVPILSNVEHLARFLGLPAYPVTPFFPWLPFPASVIPLPVKWMMRLLKSHPYEAAKSRHQSEETAKYLARFIEGGIQAELNRLLRTRIKPLL